MVVTFDEWFKDVKEKLEADGLVIHEKEHYRSMFEKDYTPLMVACDTDSQLSPD